MSTYILLVATVIIAMGWSQLCSAQVPCNSEISGIITSDVTCTGDCILNGATISGSVQCPQGTLSAKGSSLISGNILLNGVVTRAELGDVTVIGGVVVTQAPSFVELVINQTATILGSVKVDNAPGDIFVTGSLTGLELFGVSNFFANNLVTSACVLVTGGSGIVEVCDSVIGGLSLLERIGDVQVKFTTFTEGGFSATKGSGNLTVTGANFTAGDFTVSEYIGDVILRDAQVSDLKLEKSSGSLIVRNVSLDSDMTIIEQVGDVVLQNFGNVLGDTAITNQVGDLVLQNFSGVFGDLTVTGQIGDVVLRNFTIFGDALVKQVTGNVTLSESSFTLEDVAIVLVTGVVTVQNNTDLNLAVVEVGGMVRILDNVIVSGSVNKNTGGVDIIGNVFMFLSCADNVPSPLGSGNNITFPTGQCATGL